MSKQVNFTYGNGRERKMLERDAKILTKLGRGTYLTADMRAAPVVSAAPAAPAPQKSREEEKPATADDGLDAMDADDLHDLAKTEGIKVHANAGAEKVRSAIRAHRQEAA